MKSNNFKRSVSMNVTIKELADDSGQINNVREFLFGMIKKELGYGYVPKWHQDIMNLEEFYVTPEKNNFFVAYDENGEIVGTIGIRSYDKDFPEFREKYSEDSTSSIWRLFVDRKCRRCGLASKMFSVAESFANNVGYSMIYLHTHKTLDGAIEFWKKMGFVVTLDTDNELETVHMDKQILELEISGLSQDFKHAIEL